MVPLCVFGVPAPGPLSWRKLSGRLTVNQVADPPNGGNWSCTGVPFDQPRTSPAIWLSDPQIIDCRAQVCKRLNSRWDSTSFFGLCVEIVGGRSA